MGGPARSAKNEVNPYDSTPRTNTTNLSSHASAEYNLSRATLLLHIAFRLLVALDSGLGDEMQHDRARELVMGIAATFSSLEDVDRIPGTRW